MTPDVWVLLYRPSRRHKWVEVARCDSLRAAVFEIGCGDRHNGEWLPRPASAGDPNEK